MIDLLIAALKVDSGFTPGEKLGLVYDQVLFNSSRI